VCALNESLSWWEISGGSSLDLVPLFDLAKSSIHTVFDQVINWILHSFKFPLGGILRNQQWHVLQDLAQDFAEKVVGILWSIWFSGWHCCQDNVSSHEGQRIRSGPFLL